MPTEWPLPPHFDPDRLGEVWKVDYERIARAASDWKRAQGIAPAAEDAFKICLVAVDVQNTFCTPGYELYVGGRSGTGPVDDNRRLCAFLYRNLGRITQIAPTMDTHQALQIFHSVFLIDAQGNHPDPLTPVAAEDVSAGRWRFNPELAPSLGIAPEYGQRHLEHYVGQLEDKEKYDLTVWPYHAMLGGIGHALVSSVEEAIFFHTLARSAQADFHVKGNHPLTEHYSALGPEVETDPDGNPLAGQANRFFQKLRDFDMVVVAGQAKSHCVAWTLMDLLDRVRSEDPALVEKVYLLEDCTSPVVVPGVVDYTEEADDAFARFAAAGMHVVRSTEPVGEWPDAPEHVSA